MWPQRHNLADFTRDERLSLNEGYGSVPS